MTQTNKNLKDQTDEEYDNAPYPNQTAMVHADPVHRRGTYVPSPDEPLWRAKNREEPDPYMALNPDFIPEADLLDPVPAPENPVPAPEKPCEGPDCPETEPLSAAPEGFLRSDAQIAPKLPRMSIPEVVKEPVRPDPEVVFDPDPAAADLFGHLGEPQPGVSTIVRGYERLYGVLIDALDQAQRGKGAERHANGRAFTDQPIIKIGQMVGEGFPAGQAIKKTQEAITMLGRGNDQAARYELLGAIVYLSAACILIDDAKAAADEGYLPVDTLS